jgi:hypothetical protein
VKHLVLIIFTSIILLASNNFDKYFSYAQNYYWLTVDEDIGSSVYFKAIKYLKLAYNENEKYKLQNKNLYEKNLLVLNALKTEINAFYDYRKNTMGGVFPLLKFISTSFFFFPKKSRTYTLSKAPDAIAIANAVTNLTDLKRKLFQVEVFFNSENPVWNEIAFYKFNENGKYYAKLTEEVTEALKDKKLITNFYDNKIDKIIINKLLRYDEKPKIYITRLEKTPLESTESYFTATGYSYNKNGEIKKERSYSFGYSIDMRWSWPILIGYHLVLFLIVLLITYYFYVKTYRKDLFSLILIVSIGFVIGRILPWLIIPTIENLMPDNTLNVLYSLWWVALAGISIILLPIYAFDFIYSKAQKYVKLPSVTGKSGLISLSISAGVAGYLFVPFIFNYGNLFSINYLLINYIPFTIALLVSGYIAGEVLDEKYKISEIYLLFFIITSIIMFFALMHGNIIHMHIASICTILIGLFVVFVNRRKYSIKSLNNAEFSKTDNINNKDLDSLIKNPPFYNKDEQ